MFAIFHISDISFTYIPYKNPSTMAYQFGVTGNSTTHLLEQLTQQAGYSDYAVLFFSLLALTGYVTNGKIWNKPDPYLYKFYERPQEALGQGARSKETRDIAQKLEETNRDLVIFWGSQSGTAESFAHRLARECHRRFKIDAVVADLSDYDSESISLIPQSKLVIFLLSTYGEGDPSDNASEFWDWLKRNSTSLANLRYAAFGLGNSNYKYYNKVVDVLVEKLSVHNANLLLPVGKADDANSGTEEDFLEWKETLFTTFQNSLGFTEHEQTYEPSLKVVEDTSLDIIDLHISEPISKSMSRKAASLTSAIKPLSVKHIRELNTGPITDRSCLHVDLDLSDHPQMKYKTGDHLQVYPVNSTEEVNNLLEVLGLYSKKDVPLLITSLDPSNKKIKIPSPTNLSALFTHYLEIAAPVSRETVQTLIPFAPNERTEALLRNLSSTKEAYSTFLQSNHITLSRLLAHTITNDNDTSWTHLPLSFILESLSPLTPRSYSISSSSSTSPKQVSITVAVSHPYTQSTNKTLHIPGLTSSYLSNHLSNNNDNPQPKIHASIHRSTFKLPQPSTPLLLIGSGTGIAPLRAFLHERATHATHNPSPPPSKIILLYGCRNLETDNLYNTELQALKQDQGPLSSSLEIIVAESRPQPSSSPSTSTSTSSTKELTERKSGQYVQTLLTSSPALSKSIANLLTTDDGAVFFCGSTKMARGAGDAVMDAVRTYGSKENVRTREEGINWRDERRRVGRWREDVWG